ncbi:MAG: S-layer homology domain-containing protein [Acidimicrobiia bacterium]|nr:S-layer homology domain-containing protein [Acidimicrobiia bacterium]
MRHTRSVVAVVAALAVIAGTAALTPATATPTAPDPASQPAPQPEPRPVAPTEGCVAPFTDVPCGHRFFGEIRWAQETELVTGFDDGTFRPTDDVSRQALVTTLWRLEGAPEGPFDDPEFSDVDEDHQFFDAIAWAHDAGLVTGYADGTFGPTLPTSRQAFSAVLWRLEGSPDGPFVDPGFPDVDDDHPFADAIWWFAAEGFTTAYADGTFRPGAMVSRQATTAFWFRVDLWRSLDESTADRCEFLDPAHCLLAWPSDHLTTEDPTTDTGLRLDLHSESLPTPSGGPEAGAPADPSEFNRNDGFSPGSAILTQVPGIDLEATGAAPLTDMSVSLAESSPTVIVDTVTGERHLHWAELDADADDEDQVLILRPGVNFEEGRRYVVGLRNLRDDAGELIAPTLAFRSYRDAMTTGIDTVEDRRPAMDDLLGVLADAGVDGDELYLAWDFTVASQRNLSERILHIRDDAFDTLGEDAPTFTVDLVTETTPEQNANLARVVEGTVEVPLYLTGDGEPGSAFNWGDDGLPEQNGTYAAEYRCDIPHAATGADPARGAVYGHGLLGTRSEVGAGNVNLMGNEHNVMFCAVDWIGMSTPDAGNVVAILNNLSRFPTLADRVQQGILNTQFLARAIRHEDGFGAHPAFQDAAEAPLVAPGDVYFDGNSQGGIIGGAATAISTEWTRAVLGVTGMNYSLLLRRSSNWETFENFLAAAYPNRLDQTIGLSVIQLLWDRAETNGYAHHLTDDPYPGTPEHQVLLHIAFTDHQVTMWSAEIQARTANIAVQQPALVPGRHPDVAPLLGIPAVPGDGYGGSVLVYWDSGNPPPPVTNTPPLAPEFGSDPHSRPRAQVSAREQKSAFFDGTFIDVCAGEPCLAP